MQGLTFRTKFWYGIGQVAEGVKNASFGYLLLFFYSQVLGLSGVLTGLALAIALVFDAVTDPLAGSLSDSLRHRWGRRHPFIYASALPLALSFIGVFRPPGGFGTIGLFCWLTVFAVLTRFSMTLFHVPHMALGAELSTDYRERTIVVAYRTFFGYLGATVLFLLAGLIFFQATDAYPNGQLNPHVYPRLGLLFAAVMFTCILATGLGTHSRIPRLNRPPESGETFSPRRLLREIREAMAIPSFRAIFSCLILFFVARGTEVALGLNMGTYFWQLEGRHVTLIPTLGLMGVLVSIPFWALVSRRAEKKTLFLLGISWFSTLTMLAPLAKILGFFPPQESELYLPIILTTVLLGAFGGGAAVVVSGSMLADIADEHELGTGRRQEGIFFGAFSFAVKTASGIGIGLAGLSITLIRFPLQAEPGSVPESTLNALGYTAGPGVAGLAVIGILLMTRYTLDRRRHDEIRKALAESSASAASQRELPRSQAAG